MVYEQAMTELEKIIAELEKGEASLDDSLKLFEKASSLAAFCNESLDAAEQKIRQLTEAEAESKTNEE